MVVPIAGLLAAVYWWQTVLTVLLGIVKLVFYTLLRVVILPVLLVFAVRYGGYWLWRKLTGREAGPFRIRSGLGACAAEERRHYISTLSAVYPQHAVDLMA